MTIVVSSPVYEAVKYVQDTGIWEDYDVYDKIVSPYCNATDPVALVKSHLDASELTPYTVKLKEFTVNYTLRSLKGMNSG